MKHLSFLTIAFFSNWKKYQIPYEQDESYQGKKIFAKLIFPCGHYDYEWHVFRYYPETETICAFLNINGEEILIETGERRKTLTGTIKDFRGNICPMCTKGLIFDPSFKIED